MKEAAPDRGTEGIPCGARTQKDLFPEAVIEVIDSLGSADEPAWLIGECVHEALSGTRPRVFQARSSFPPRQVLAVLSNAVPTAPDNARFMVPTPAGPVDILSAGQQNDLESELRRRTFSIHAMAFDPRADHLYDPHGGLPDTRALRLRGVADPAHRFARMPLEALRGAGLLARFGYELDSNLVPGFRAAIPGFPRIPRAELRRTLVALLGLPLPGRAIATLRATGVEASLFNRARSDTAAILDELPPDPGLRLAAWLRETDAQKHLHRLRFPRALSNRVQRLLRHHPIDSTQVVRTRARLSAPDRADLFQLRRAELHHATNARGETETQRQRLDQLETRLAENAAELDREQLRTHLALDGSQVMAILGCEPGRRVGNALRFLTDHVARNPEANTADQLRAQLEEWGEKHPA